LAKAKPMPCDEPVTRARRPSRENRGKLMIFSLLSISA
jgi:hypothetical protein